MMLLLACMISGFLFFLPIWILDDLDGDTHVLVFLVHSSYIWLAGDFVGGSMPWSYLGCLCFLSTRGLPEIIEHGLPWVVCRSQNKQLRTLMLAAENRLCNSPL